MMTNDSMTTRGSCGIDSLLRGMRDKMENINASSKKIAEIIKVIYGKAFQTNLVAINAMIKAVRAGEQAEEFWVVAEETVAASGELLAQSNNLMEQVKILSAQIGGEGDGAVLTHSGDSVGRARRRDTARQRGKSTKNVTLVNQHVNSKQTGRKGRPNS